jgi:hypothetical protein
MALLSCRKAVFLVRSLVNLRRGCLLEVILLIFRIVYVILLATFGNCGLSPPAKGS